MQILPPPLRASQVAEPQPAGPVAPAGGAGRPLPRVRRARFAALWAAAVLVPALFLALAGWLAWHDVQAEARDRIARRAEVLREHAQHVFEVQEAILTAAESRVSGIGWEAIAGSRDVLEFLRALDQGTPSSEFITLVAPDGRVALHSRLAAPGWLGLDAADREWFQRAREAGPGGGTVIGEVVQGRLDGTAFFALSRARRGERDGAFDGVVAVSVRIAAIEEFYRSIAESPRDAVTLARADGAVLARHPAPPERFGGRALPNNPVVVAQRESATGRGFVRTTSAFDGIERLVAFHRIEGYPAFVAYGLDTAVLGAAWRQRLLAPGLGALAAALLLLWLTHRVQAASRRETAALAEATAEAEHARNEALARIEAEARLRHAEKLSALGQIASGIAHDFNNLVQAVTSATRLLDRRAEDPEEVRRVTAMTADAAARGGRIARRMLDFVRRGASGAESFDLTASLRGVGELLHGMLGAGLRLEFEVPEGLPPALADRAEFETVVINLAVNARDAMAPGGGTIRIDVAREQREAPAAALSGLDPGAEPAMRAGIYLRIAIADTGTGMPPEVLARAGEPFFTTKPDGKGTGLGLAMARRFAVASGGALLLESAPGEGTVVTLWLRAVVADGPVENGIPAVTDRRSTGLAK